MTFDTSRAARLDFLYLLCDSPVYKLYFPQLLNPLFKNLPVVAAL